MNWREIAARLLLLGAVSLKPVPGGSGSLRAVSPSSGGRLCCNAVWMAGVEALVRARLIDRCLKHSSGSSGLAPRYASSCRFLRGLQFVATLQMRRAWYRGTRLSVTDAFIVHQANLKVVSAHYYDFLRGLYRSFTHSLWVLCHWQRPQVLFPEWSIASLC